MPNSHSFYRRLRFLLWSGAAVFALAIAGLVVLRDPSAPIEVAYSGEADIRSDFELIDHTGRAVTQADYAGRWQLVFFGFTNCPDVCPTTLAYMATALDLLNEDADRIAPLFITVDPERDTPEVMADYVANFHPDLVGLTGSNDQVTAAAHAFKVYHEQLPDAEAADGYRMAHAGHIYLMRPDGRFEAVFLEGDQPPEDLAREIEMRLEAEERS
ncbi:SCO family protein [Limimaricola cinnabarinus]|uniref:Electron transporter n=1 Tax=Limimaricola cinnabarinus TaxID=1125964 RepID=A0A2G1MCS1_9RHOB|nr:SCO family protein [Limimaricola cinnabarinus]PHP26543.1 electron transporter [Limimaricola cinnabarinus]